MTDDELLEALADAEHESWSSWMEYLFSVGTLNADGSHTIEARSVAHWKRQVATPYAALSERERESDRQEVRRILPHIRKWAGAS